MLTGVDWRMYLVSHLTGRILIGNRSGEGKKVTRMLASSPRCASVAIEQQTTGEEMHRHSPPVSGLRTSLADGSEGSSTISMATEISGDAVTSSMDEFRAARSLNSLNEKVYAV